MIFINLFELSAKLSLDTTEFDTGIDSTQKKSQSFGSSLGSLFGKGVGVLATGITTAIGVASTAIGALGTIGFNYNKQMETYTTNFEVMLGSQEKAVEKVAQLQEMASDTPFEMTQLADATQQLLTFGIASEDTQGILQMLGDVSLGNSERFSSLAYAFGQVQSTGKLMGQDLQQMINVGFNPLQVISEQTGESMDSLKQKMSEGAISADLVTEAFRIATSEGGQFFNGMKEGAQTTAGLISTLKDDVNILIGSVFQPMSDSILNEWLPTLIEGVAGMSDAFKTGGIDGMIASAGTFIGDLITKIVEQLPQLLDTGVRIVNALLQALIDNADKLSNGAVQIMTTLVQGIITILPQMLSLGLTLLLELAKGIAQSLPTLLPQIVTVMLEMVNTFIQNLPLIINAAIQIILALIEGLVEAIPILITYLPTIIDSIITALTTALPQIILAAVQIIIALVNGLVEALPILVAMLPQIIMTVINGILTALPQLLAEAPKIIMTVIDGLLNALPHLLLMAPQIILTVIDGIVKTLPQLLAKAPEIITNIINGITNTMWQLLDKARQIIPDIISAIGEKIGNMINVGKDIVNGVKKGIQDAWNSLTGWFSGLFSGLEDTARSSLDSNSPSKVFVRIGEDTALGFEVGWQEEMKKAKKIVEADMTFDTQGNVGGVSGINQATGQMVTVNQTIYSQAQTAADLMQEALYQQKRAVLMGV